MGVKSALPASSFPGLAAGHWLGALEAALHGLSGEGEGTVEPFDAAETLDVDHAPTARIIVEVVSEDPRGVS